jgi:hypothetical protein
MNAERCEAIYKKCANEIGSERKEGMNDYISICTSGEPGGIEQ